MSESKRIRSCGSRHTILGMTILLLLVVTPLTAAAGSEGGGGYSGDDAYDPAAGRQPETSLIAPFQRSTSSFTSTYSGDDASDPAAGGTPGQSAPALSADGASPVDCGLSAD